MTNLPRKLVFLWNAVSPPLAVAACVSGAPALGIGCVMSAHALLALGVFLPKSRLLGPLHPLPVMGENQVWLTIDDGPHPEDTPRLLEQLDEAGASATFFVIGERVARHPDLVREILHRGHTVGNHTWSHPAHTFWRAGPKRIREELTRTSALLEDLTGQPVPLFRPPAGFVSPALHPELELARLTPPMLWSIRGLDGTDRDAARIQRRLRAGLRSGAVILMHEGQVHTALDGRRLAPVVLANLLADLKERGLRCSIPIGA